MMQVSLLSSNTLFAAPAEKHSHNGRTHSHPLPASGVKHFHKHLHNGRAHIHPYSAKVGFKHSHNLSPRAKAWANAVRHKHGDRSHSHPLPPAGIKHPHRHKHGGRSHIHPLPITGTKHFHHLNRKGSSPTKAKTISKPQMITGLSIKQQIQAVLNTPIKTKTKPNKKRVVAANKLRATKTNNRHINKKQQKPSRKLTNVTSNNRKIVKRKKVQKPPKKIIRPVNQTPQQILEGNRQFSLALRYENGTGVKKNLAQAVNWYLRSAKNGNAKAQFNLASMYENGEGTARNIPQAIRWYTTAANNGDANAQVNLGNQYARGINIPKNIQKAAKWYKRAADQGDMRGRANLNYLIEDNNGILTLSFKLKR